MVSMFHDYKGKHPKSTIHIDTYRNCLKQHNISFVKLGEEECEACEEHKQHLSQYHYHVSGNVENVSIEECEVCNDHENHVSMAKLGRRFYGIDRDVDDDETTYLSSDMQKVIMLPRLPGCKTVIFQKRLTTYHQTFSPLGKGEKSLSVIWHNGIRKRNDEDVASAYVIAIKQFRDSNIIVIWVDNWSEQNKNWTLLLSLLLSILMLVQMKSS